MMKLNLLTCAGLLIAALAANAKPSEEIKNTVGSWITGESLGFKDEILPESQVEDYLGAVLDYVSEGKVTDISYWGRQINTRDRWLAVIEVIKTDRLTTLVLPELERNASYRASVQRHLAAAFSKLKNLSDCWYKEEMLDDPKNQSTASEMLESVMRHMEKKAITKWAPAFYVATYTSPRVKTLYWMKKYFPLVFRAMEKDLTPSTREALKAYEEEMNKEGAEDNW